MGSDLHSEKEPLMQRFARRGFSAEAGAKALREDYLGRNLGRLDRKEDV